jgi:hypothetical protein
MVAFFVVGIAFMATSGVQVLIPETGQNGRDWIADVDDAGGLFVVGAWLVVFGGLIGLIALIGFYDALRSAGQIMVIAPVAAVVGLTLVTISHAIPIAIAYELVPDYVDATGATRESLGSTLDVLASICLITNYVGNAFNWGVVVPLYGFAILSTNLLPRWLGWLGVFVGVLGGWVGLLSPLSGVIEGITTPAFFGFFIWVAGMGVALLRRPAAEELVPAPSA